MGIGLYIVQYNGQERKTKQNGGLGAEPPAKKLNIICRNVLENIEKSKEWWIMWDQIG